MQRPRPLRGPLSEEVEVLRRLDAHGVDGRTAATAASVWGAGAAARIEADPYALALLEPWETVDGRALRMGVHPCDGRRLGGFKWSSQRLGREDCDGGSAAL